MRPLRAAALLAALACFGSVGAGLSGANATATSTNAGNTFSAVPDFLAPRVTMEDPLVNVAAPDTALRGTVTFRATVTGVSTTVPVTFQRALGAGAYANLCTAARVGTTNVYACTVNTVTLPLADGTYGFRALAGTVGHVTTSAAVTNRVVDNTIPTAAAATVPPSPLGGSVSLTATAADAIGVASVRFQYRLDGSAGAWSDCGTDTTAAYSCVLDTATMVPASGIYDFQVIARDRAGNERTSATIQNRVVDNTAPTVSMTAPPANLRGSVTVTSTAADAVGVASVRIQTSTDGVTWTDRCTDLTGPPYTCAVVTTALPNSTHQFRAVARDTAGNETPSTPVASSLVDNVVPTATMTDPGTNLRGTQTFGATAADTGSGVLSVTIQRSPANANTWTNVCAADTTSPYSCTINTTTLTDGLYDFRAVAIDSAQSVPASNPTGNQTISALVEDRRIDNTNPTGTAIETPQQGSITGTVQPNDSIAFTFSEAMDPGSIIGGWDGTGSKNVRLRVEQNGGNDRVHIEANGDGTPNLGTVAMNGNFVNTTDAVFNAALTANGAGTVFTVTVGANQSGGGANLLRAGNAGMSWTPSTSAQDLSGLAASNTQVNETGGNDRDF